MQAVLFFHLLTISLSHIQIFCFTFLLFYLFTFKQMVSVFDLHKQYGRVDALRGLSFSVDEGEIYGIIGPDGAGKTSLFRILATLMLPDGGRATVDGLDVVRDYRELRRRIGYMPGRFSLYQDLSVEENLQFFASVFNTTVEQNYGLIKDVYSRLEPFKARRAGKLSGGMKQKLALCCALIHAPRVLLLDEPTTGVDPVSRREFWQMLQRISKEHGITVLVSTPYMDEASWCDRISLMQGGRLLQTGTPAEICESYSANLFAVRSDDMHRLLGDLKECPCVMSAFSFGDSIHVTLDGVTASSALTEYLQQRGHAGVEVKRIRPSVEDCFMSLMKNQTV